ncbi:MAG: type II toxin-antitoxin system HicA family toxin [Pyrinomonadaceae bacterium]
MKRKALIRHLEKNGCAFRREGGNHTVYKNLANGRMTAIPRHTEIKENLAKKICDDLGVPRASSDQ